GKRLYLKPNKELTFGRKKSDILLQNDESISRLHASIHVEPKEVVEVNEPISICKLKDMGSKYGTYILMGEEERIEVTQEGYHLKDQDKLRFGLQQHIFTVVYVPIITVVSTLNETDKSALRSIIDEIDGMISSEWTSNCTHLTVSKATLTEKVTWAMASAVPIVNLNYWKEVKHAVDNGQEFPKSEDFVPPITESLINARKVSLHVNEKRKILFQNLIFVHFSAHQYRAYWKMINMASGKSLLYSKKPLSRKEICAPNVIVLQYSDSDSTQSTQRIVPEYDAVYSLLQTNKRKMISESDIPLAILHCSVEKYCNPKFRFGEFLKRSQIKFDSSAILALDTQDVMPDVRILPKVISNVPLKSNVNVKTSTQKFEIIPESNDISSMSILNKDSYPLSLDRLRTSTPKMSQDTRNLINNIELLKESVVVNKGTQFHEVIDLSDEEDDKVESVQLKYNKNFNNILSQEKLDKLLHTGSLRKKSPEIEDVIIQQKHNILSSTKVYKNMSKLPSQKMEQNVERLTKTNKRPNEYDDEVEFLTSTRKRRCSETTVTENTIESSCIVRLLL
ncbi:Nibrin, partial [Dufourea novaeangliae]